MIGVKVKVVGTEMVPVSGPVTMLTVTKTNSVASRETTKERSVGRVAVIPEGVVE